MVRRERLGGRIDYLDSPGQTEADLHREGRVARAKPTVGGTSGVAAERR